MIATSSNRRWFGTRGPTSRGVAAVGSTIRADQAAGRYERLLVRVLGSRRDVVFLSMPDDWAAFDLTQLSTPRLLGTESWSSVSGPGDSTMEIGTARLADGTLFQVGKSTEARAELLVRFRRVLLVDLVSVVVISFVGGAVLTYWGLQPIRDSDSRRARNPANGPPAGARAGPGRPATPWTN